MRQIYSAVRSIDPCELGEEEVPCQLRSFLLRKLVDVYLCSWIAHIDSHLKQVPELIELAEFPLRERGVLPMANASRCLDEILHFLVSRGTWVRRRPTWRLRNKNSTRK